MAPELSCSSLSNKFKEHLNENPSRETPADKAMDANYPKAVIQSRDSAARKVIWFFSAVVFTAVVALNRVQIPAPAGWDVHVFAKVNAVINSTVAVVLVAGLIAAKSGRWSVHRGLMLTAMTLSACFLISYILHHLFAGDTPYGGQGAMRWLYYSILISHIVLAAFSLPFILWTAYWAIAGRYGEHRRLARRIWPVWFYVSLSGVLVYWMIRPYY